jgi:putative SOS response-associated peptidase YedK
MCGRFNLTTPAHEIAAIFEVAPTHALSPRFNIAPTQPIVAIRMQADKKKRELVLLRWGLIPSWSKEPKVSFNTINARADTVATKPAYRAAFKQRRCLIPADGFFEWRKGPDNEKQPFHIHMKNDSPFAFAGIWERWQRAGEPGIESCSIIVTEANELMASIHDRMPVILPREVYQSWLDPGVVDVHRLESMLKPFASNEMEAYPVSTIVNHAKNNVAECIVPLA